MPPSWLPNWQNPRKYPDPAKASRLDWAWQFLRRNPDYQRMWSTLIAPNYNPVHVDRSLERVNSRISDRVRRYLKDYMGHYPLHVFQQRFGIVTVPLNPAEPKPKIHFAAQYVRYSRKPLNRPGSISTTPQDDEVLIWFDLKWPIEAQLKKSKALLTKQIKERPLSGVPFKFRYRPDQYPKYLRLLDAKESSASDRIVAAALYPHLPNKYPDYAGDHQVGDDRAVAEQLRDSPYRIAAGG
jgi:hypothetical protein